METLEIIIICFVSAIAILIAIIKVREEKHELREIDRRHEKIYMLLLIENLLDIGVRLKFTLRDQNSVERDIDGSINAIISVHATTVDLQNILKQVKEWKGLL